MQKGANVGSKPVIYALDTHRVRPGDVLLTRVPMSFDDKATWSSHMIQKVTKSRFSHAALCIEPGVFIEAVGTGIARLVPVQAGLKDEANICVLRLRTDSVAQATSVARRAAAAGQQFLQQGFSRRVVPSGKVSSFQDPKRAATFSAQLIAHAFEDAELQLLEDKASEAMFPGDIHTCAHFQDVTEQCLLPIRRDVQPQFYFDDMSMSERTHHWEAVTKLKILCNYDVRRILDGFKERPASFRDLESILCERKLRPLDEAIYRGLSWYRFADLYLQQLHSPADAWIEPVATSGAADAQLGEEQLEDAVAFVGCLVKEQEKDRENRAQEYHFYTNACAKFAGKTFTYLAEFHGRLLEISSRTLEARQQRLHQLLAEVQRRGEPKAVPNRYKNVVPALQVATATAAFV